MSTMPGNNGNDLPPPDIGKGELNPPNKRITEAEAAAVQATVKSLPEPTRQEFDGLMQKVLSDLNSSWVEADAAKRLNMTPRIQRVAELANIIHAAQHGDQNKAELKEPVKKDNFTPDVTNRDLDNSGKSNLILLPPPLDVRAQLRDKSQADNQKTPHRLDPTTREAVRELNEELLDSRQIDPNDARSLTRAVIRMARHDKITVDEIKWLGSVDGKRALSEALRDNPGDKKREILEDVLEAHRLEHRERGQAPLVPGLPQLPPALVPLPQSITGIPNAMPGVLGPVATAGVPPTDKAVLDILHQGQENAGKIAELTGGDRDKAIAEFSQNAVDKGFGKNALQEQTKKLEALNALSFATKEFVEKARGEGAQIDGKDLTEENFAKPLMKNAANMSVEDIEKQTARLQENSKKIDEQHQGLGKLKETILAEQTTAHNLRAEGDISGSVHEVSKAGTHERRFNEMKGQFLNGLTDETRALMEGIGKTTSSATLVTVNVQASGAAKQTEKAPPVPERK